jgi:hypothetical protein
MIFRFREFSRLCRQENIRPPSDCEFSARNAGGRDKGGKAVMPVPAVLHALAGPSEPRTPMDLAFGWGKRGADFSSASSDFKSLGAFFCNFVTLGLVGRSRAPSAARPRTRSCRFEASEAIPFPGGDSIFSSRCGAISGRLLFAVSLSRRDPGDRGLGVMQPTQIQASLSKPFSGLSLCYFNKL